jgi:hypothetical protein
MYGGMQAALADERAGTGASAADQAAAQIRAFTRAAASGGYPHLAAALAVAGPAPDEDNIFDSAISHLTEVAFPPPPRPPSPHHPDSSRV